MRQKTEVAAIFLSSLCTRAVMIAAKHCRCASSLLFRDAPLFIGKGHKMLM